MGRLMHDGLEQAAARFGERVFVRMGDDAWSFAEIDGRANAFARHLASRGVGARDRVALMTTNRPEFVIAVNAISKLGAAAVLVSPAWKALEVGHAVTLTKPVHGVADGAGVELLAEHLDVTDLDANVIEQERDALPPTNIAETDESVLVFSSG